MLDTLYRVFEPIVGYCLDGVRDDLAQGCRLRFIFFFNDVFKRFS